MQEKPIMTLKTLVLMILARCLLIVHPAVLKLRMYDKKHLNLLRELVIAQLKLKDQA